MKPLKIAVATKNPAKIKAVQETFEELGEAIELIAAETESGVAAQPLSIAETRQGAINRATAAMDRGIDLAFGLEGGVFELENSLYVCNWGALKSADGSIYTAAGAQIPLPEEVADELRKGAELGPVMDRYANETGIRDRKGAVGILTGNLINRSEMFSHIVRLLIGQYRVNSG